MAKRLPPEVRFWQRVNKTETCWLWLGDKIKSGYGRFYVGKENKQIYAHRYSWVLHCGKLLYNQDVLHKCNNKHCVNPQHLCLDTPEERQNRDESRFWSFVNKTEICWLWTGNIVKNGYGHFKLGKSKTVKAHRYSYEIHNLVKLNSTDNVLHKCDVRNCVRPEHLYVGSLRQNQTDRLLRKKGNKLSRKDAEEIFNNITESNMVLAQRYNVRENTIQQVRGGRTWNVINNGKSSWREHAKLTPTQAAEIKTSIERNSVLAKRYGVSQATICLIKKGERWGHVTPARNT